MPKKRTKSRSIGIKILGTWLVSHLGTATDSTGRSTFLSQMQSQFGRVESVSSQPVATPNKAPHAGRLPAVWHIGANRSRGKAEILLCAKQPMTRDSHFALLLQYICELQARVGGFTRLHGWRGWSEHLVLQLARAAGARSALLGAFDLTAEAPKR
jgi:hypothetical protein